MNKVYEDSVGLTRCGGCHAELLCDECGDMPDVCPACGGLLDWSNRTDGAQKQ